MGGLAGVEVWFQWRSVEMEYSCGSIEIDTQDFVGINRLRIRFKSQCTLWNFQIIAVGGF